VPLGHKVRGVLTEQALLARFQAHGLAMDEEKTKK
jgi:hypothetical protein